MVFRYWRLDDHRGVDLLKADASAHRYARHSHEGYAIGVVSTGAHAFTARGAVWTAVPGRIVIVNPDDAHDGGPAGSDDRYSYRMIYVDESVMSATLAEAVCGRAAVPFFPRAVVEDAALATRLLTLHRSLEYPHARLERETRLITALVELARRHGGAAQRGGTRARQSRVVARAIDYLAENFAEECSLADLASLSGVDRFHLLRAFRRAVGLPPHLYQTQLRLRHARRLMLAGEKPAFAAASAGFADQSHLIRKFKAAYGITPGQYLGDRRRAKAGNNALQ